MATEVLTTPALFYPDGTVGYVYPDQDHLRKCVEAGGFEGATLGVLYRGEAYQARGGQEYIHGFTDGFTWPQLWYNPR